MDNVNKWLMFAANLGVIAGIIFLAYEVRQNTIAVNSEASQGLQDQWTTINSMLLEEGMADIFFKGMNNPEELNDLERGKYSVWWITALYGWENAYFQMNEGAYSQSRAEGLWQVLSGHLNTPGFQEYWNLNGQYIVSDEFRQFVENDVKSIEPLSSFNSNRINDR